MNDPERQVFQEEPRKETFEKHDSNRDNRLGANDFNRLVEAEEYPITDKEIIMRTTDEDKGSAYDSSRICRPPFVLITFTVLQIICYTVDHIKTEESKSNNMGPIATLFIFNPKRRYELWRFLSYMFVHNGLTHLFTNVVSQIFLGFVLETVQRWWRVTLVYIAGVLAGSMGSSLFTPRVSLAGASAGGFALITAHVAAIIMNWSETVEGGIVQLFVVFAFLALEYYFTDVARISNIAHVCGALAGFLIGIAVMWNMEEVWWEQKLKRFAIALYFMLMGIGIGYHFLNPAYFV